MSLNRDEVNPLNVLNLRRLSFIPDHFVRINIDHKVDTKNIEKWIEYNLNCRYGMIKNYIVNQDNKIVQIIEIGFEDPKELIMLTLGCNLLHKFKKEY